MKKPSLNLSQQLQRRVIPKVILTLGALFIGLLLIYYFAAQNQLSIEHKHIVTSLDERYTSQLNNIKAITKHLAQNDFLTSAITDKQVRENYLPLFIQNFKLDANQSTGLALFDESGQRVLSSDWQIDDAFLDEMDWYSEVLVEHNTFQSVSPLGLISIAPILISNKASGAFALHYPSLQALLNFESDHAFQFIYDSQGQLTFSNMPGAYTNYATLQAFQSALEGFFSYQETFDHYTIISIEKYSIAYAHSFWLLAVMITIFIALVLFSSFSTKLAANAASHTLKKLHLEISEQLNKENDIVVDDENEAKELVEIRMRFNALRARVLSLSLSNDKVFNVINSLHELLFVLNNKNEITLTNQLAQEFLNRHSLSSLHVSRMLEAHMHCKDTHVQQVVGNAIVIWRFSPIHDEHGQHDGFIVTGEDVTHQRRTEDKLHLRTKALEASNMAFVISRIDQDDQPIIYANKAFYDLTAYSPSEVIGKNCRFLQGPASEPDKIKEIREAVANHRSLEVTLTNYRKDGSTFMNQLMLTPVADSDGKVRHYIGSQQDVTVREQTARYLAEAKHQAEEFADVQKRFFASMNHELRTPINGITGMLNALERTSLQPQQTNFVRLAKQSADNLLSIVNDILEYSRAESGGIQLEKTHFDIENMLNDVYQNYKIQCESKGLHFHYQSLIKIGTHVYADSLRIQQIIKNLLNNALKFTEKGHISISAEIRQREDGQQIFACSIRDSGIGIAPEKQDKVFDIFAQASSSTSRLYGGTGLGLSICKQLCELMGGQIDVQSELGKGSVFRFWIELELSSGLPDAFVGKDIGAIQAPSILPRLIIAEDNQINQSVMLANLNEFPSVVAENGLQVMNILQSTKVDIGLILMDCQMPEMDGYTATHLIRDGYAGEKYRDIPIIAVTAHAMEEDRQRCLDAGMTDYVSKPIDMELLRSKIYQWTEQPHQLS